MADADRERLTALLMAGAGDCLGKGGTLNCSKLADYLLEHGVIVLPCKVGDTYYTVQKYCNTDPFDTKKEPVMPWDCENYCCRDDCSFKEYRVDEHRFDTVGFILSAKGKIGKTVFLTREEAERALKEWGDNA